MTTRHHTFLHLTFVGLFFMTTGWKWGHAHEWTIPLAGNVYRTAPGPGGRDFPRDGFVPVRSADEIFSAFVYFDRPAKIRLSIVGKSSSDSTTLSVRLGEQERRAELVGSDVQTVATGEFEISQKGYVQFDLRVISDDGQRGVDVRELKIESTNDGLTLDFVQSNDGNMFYWGRRGPSVHLGYRVPSDLKVQYAYSEIFVPEGEDPLGTYYMAIGFSEGYFGMQVNGPAERRVLFSIWSPFKTDNPRDIPKDQQIEALAKGPGVHLGEFGNEGSGGQSYLVYPWTTGKPYRFLVEVTPDGMNQTVYTGWFSEKGAGPWQLIARFRRPKTNTYLKGFHSFLESFSPTHGYLGRRAFYQNQWVYSVDGKWHECTEARFTVDATGSKRHRVDYMGGIDRKVFLLKNCGFFSETSKPGTVLQRESTANDQPQVDFGSLPRE
jgi:Domain of unknown function (DUF3472)/Domain of unknown function (DUF5077)